MKRLLQILTVLLAVHVGFAQAQMVHAPVGEPAHVQSDTAEAAPCHGAASESLPSPDASKHKKACCDAGNCHCAAVCAMPCASMVMTSEIASTPGFILHSAPTVMRVPDLRPPIL